MVRGTAICRSSFITTPIFYANGPPHLGHLYTTILADASHRWNRLKDPSGTHVFTAGTDEHGSKIAKTAAMQGVPVTTLCASVSSSFSNLFREFDVQHTRFVRTTEQGHRECVETVWNRLDKAGYLEKSKYSGWYSTTDECFYQQTDIEDTDKVKVARETRSTVEWHEETNYVFTLEPFQERIRTWLTRGDIIQPRHYLPIALRYISAQSRLSVSRDSSRLSWGIPVPGDPSQTIYVWLDALCNYLTCVNFPSSIPPLWPPTTQIIGKDIMKFHAVYWPAFLMAAELELPKRLFVHGHWLVEGSKMSKSVGNVIDPFEAAKLLSHEGLRYFLLKQGVPHDDSSFGYLKATNVINADLINNMANLISRACVSKLNPSQAYPFMDVIEVERELQGAKQVVEEIKCLREKVQPLYDKMLFYKAIEEIVSVSKLVNAFFQMNSPWKLKPGPSLSSILYITYESSRIMSILLQPITPQLSNFALSRLGIPNDHRSLEDAVFGGGKDAQSGNKLGEDNGIYMERISIEDKEKVVKKKKERRKNGE